MREDKTGGGTNVRVAGKHRDGMLERAERLEGLLSVDPLS